MAREPLKFDGIPRAAASLEDKLRAYMSARGATDLGWSPKGELLVATRFGDSTQLHLVTRAGGERRQLTFFADPVDQAAFSPDPWHDGFVFSKDAGGNERYQLYYQRVGEPTARRLTPPHSANGGAVWSNAGGELAFFSGTGGGHGDDIDVMSVQGGAAAHVVLAADGSSAAPLDWSPDDRRLLVLKTAAAQDAHLEIVDLGSGARHELAPDAPRGAITEALFSRDGQGVYLITDRYGEFRQLRFLNIFTGKVANISGPGPGDVEDFALSRDGHYLAYVRAQGGSDRLALIDLRAHEDLPAPALPSAGFVDSLHFDLRCKRLAFTFEAANRPRDPYVLTIATNRIEAWTQSEPGAVDLAKFVGARLAHFPTFDRVGADPREIPVYLFEPAAPGPHPVLIQFDARRTAFRPGFDPWIQFLVNELGVAVVAPNLRGSSGYGKEFAALGAVSRREDVVKDIGALLVWIETRKNLDAKRIVVSGRSYGGYLTLAALANFGDRLRGGVEMAASFDGLSPIPYAQRIGKPMLIAQGINDPRVAVGEAKEILGLLRSNRVEAGLLLATGEGHELRRKPDRDAYYAAFAQFLTQRMR